MKSQSLKGNSDTATAILQGGTPTGSTTAQVNTVALRDAINTIAYNFQW